MKLNWQKAFFLYKSWVHWKKNTPVFFFSIYILKNISLDITKTVLRPSVSERKALPLFWNIFRFLPFFFKDANFEPYNLARLFIVTFEIFRSEKMPIDVVEQSCWEIKSDSICSIDFDVLVLYNQFLQKQFWPWGCTRARSCKGGSCYA